MTEDQIRTAKAARQNQRDTMTTATTFFMIIFWFMFDPFNEIPPQVREAAIGLAMIFVHRVNPKT